MSDPRSCGARCDECPLRDVRDGPPVLLEDNGSDVTIVGQVPGPSDVEAGRPMVGAFGVELARALSATGRARHDANWTYAVACQPPGGDWSRFMTKLEAENRRRVRQGFAPHPTPQECCLPRLRHDLQGVEQVIAVGTLAAHGVTGSSAALADLRGQLLTVPALSPAGGNTGREWLVVPTVANFMYARRWKKVMRADVTRALAWFSGQLPWRPFEKAFYPQPDAEGFCQPLGEWQAKVAFQRIEAYLAARPKRLTIDVETKARRWNGDKPLFDPLDDELRCVGFADETSAIVVGVRSVRLAEPEAGPGSDGVALWPPDYEEALAELVLAYVESDAVVVGHNFAYYDALVLEQWLEAWTGRRPRWTKVLDTLMAARVIEPELPKGLGFVATLHLPEGTPAWKADHTATTTSTDIELFDYNALDVVINSRLVPIFAKQVRERDQSAVLRSDTRMQQICAGLHRVGLKLREDKRLEWSEKLTVQAAEQQHAMLTELKALGVDPYGFGKGEELFNPNSPYHLRALLFDQWDLPPPAQMKPREIFTATGERSVGKPIVNAYLADEHLSEYHPFLEAKRRYTKAVKLLGTYVTKGDPNHPETFVRAETGRVHAEWKAYGTLVGRPACSGPNLLNQPKALRDMYEAQPGFSYVSADWSALHLRLIAARWQIPSLLEAFAKGLDAHALFAGVMFGDRFWKAGGHPPGPRGASGDYEGDAGKMRSVAKTMRYAGAYMATPETIWRVMRSTENKTGELIFKHIALKYVYGLYEAWMNGEPEWQQAWDREIEEWKLQGYKLSPILGRRIDFIDGEYNEDDDEIEGNIGNKLVNTPILTAEADFANMVLAELVDELPFERWGPGTGLVQTNYDSILLEVPTAEAARWQGVLHDLMNRSLPGWQVPFTADVKICQTWDQG